MSAVLLHSMDAPWNSSDINLLEVLADAGDRVEGAASNRITARSGALNAFASNVPAAPINLTAFDELRFWIRSSRRATGVSHPFYLAFSYTDLGDLPNEEHRWLIPVNQANIWDQRRIGIENDRRSAINAFRFTCLGNDPFSVRVDELLAVHEEMIPDAEDALTRHVQPLMLPGLVQVALAQTAAAGATRVIVPLNLGFRIGNGILIRGGAAGDEVHNLSAVTHDPPTNETTLVFAAGETAAGLLAQNVASVTVLIPLVFELPSPPGALTNPVLVATHLDAREDPQRSGHYRQRDSFRPRNTGVFSSVRAAARAYTLDYQITVTAPDRRQQTSIQTGLLQRLSMDVPLRINGVPSPVSILPPPGLLERALGVLAPVYVRIGTRMEVAPRAELPVVRQAEIRAARGDAPLDQEGIVLTP